jgi:hypothetical protein
MERDDEEQSHNHRTLTEFPEKDGILNTKIN